MSSWFTYIHKIKYKYYFQVVGAVIDLTPTTYSNYFDFCLFALYKVTQAVICG